jgi:Flp pilus assembly protein protease CpaA
MTPAWATDVSRFTVLLVCLVAAVTDAWKELIPNWLTFPAIGIGVLFWLAVDFPLGGAWSMATMLLTAAVPYFMFRRGAFAGGDVKLFAAVGAVLGGDYEGLSVSIEALLFSTMAAAAYALLRLAWEGKLIRTIANAVRLAFNPVLPKKYRKEIAPELMSKVRLGVPALAGTLTAVLLRYPGLWMT